MRRPKGLNYPYPLMLLLSALDHARYAWVHMFGALVRCKEGYDKASKESNLMNGTQIHLRVKRITITRKASYITEDI